jgi:hypothetical protein
VSNLPKPVLFSMVLSIAMNLFFLGIWAGRHWPLGAHQFGPERFGVQAFLHRSGLGDAGPAVQQIIQAQRAALPERMRAMGQARAEVRAALQAEPFDAARLDTALAALETRMTNMQHDMHVTLAQVAGAVDAAHRARMADALWPRPGMGRRGLRF